MDSNPLTPKGVALNFEFVVNLQEHGLENVRQF